MPVRSLHSWMDSRDFQAGRIVGFSFGKACGASRTQKIGQSKNGPRKKSSAVHGLKQTFSDDCRSEAVASAILATTPSAAPRRDDTFRFLRSDRIPCLVEVKG